MTSNIFRVALLGLLQVSIVPMVHSKQDDDDAKHILCAPAEWLWFPLWRGEENINEAIIHHQIFHWVLYNG